MSDEFIAWCRELLAALGTVRTRRMFGGHGAYVDEVFVALIANDVLYLKVDDATRPQFLAAGCSIFEYHTAAGRHGSLGYFNAPAEAMESPALMLPWARLAMMAALRARNAQPAKARRQADAAVRARPAARKTPSR